jgi:hypothetical protein
MDVRAVLALDLVPAASQATDQPSGPPLATEMRRLLPRDALADRVGLLMEVVAPVDAMRLISEAVKCVGLAEALTLERREEGHVSSSPSS